MKYPQKITALVIVSLLAAPSALAVSDAEFRQLQAQLNALAERVRTLEADNARLREQAADNQPLEQKLVGPEPPAAAESELAVAEAQPGPAFSLMDRISVKGDFRYRYETTDVERQDRRERERIRARAEIQARLSPTVMVGTGIATGGTDPVSANQTLGQGGTRKDLDLNLAYARWEPLEGSFLSLGKMKNNFYRPQGSGLLWDSDYSPEGLSAGWSAGNFFAIGGLYWLESDTLKDDHQATWGAQLGVKLDIGDNHLTAGIGYFDIPVSGNTSYYGDDDDFYGNSFRCEDFDSADYCTYRFDYEELELFADFTLNTLPIPLTLYLDYVQNLSVDQYEQGWLFGVSAGGLGRQGQWEIGYEYEDLDADAVFGLLSGSDFAAGGTDGRGHHLFGGYALSSNVHLALTWYINNKFGRDRLVRALDYDRIMVDAVFVY